MVAKPLLSPLYPPSCPEIQAAAAALARLRELSAASSPAGRSPAAQKAHQAALLDALEAVFAATLQTAWRAELALAVVTEARRAAGKN